ncbi:MAG TPA: energy transducer TonB [Gemmatimonadales bacterium]|nr:energy transducer TonB [Gemmatimonadales bacterium]
MRSFSLVLLLTMSPVAAAAQDWPPGEGATWLHMGAVDLQIAPHSSKGVQLWAVTSATRTKDSPRSYIAGFDPALVEPWLDQAGSVVYFDGPAPGDSAQALATPGLMASDGSQLAILRKRKGHGWATDVTVIFLDPTDQRSWSFTASNGEAREFLQAFLAQEGMSHFVPGGVTTADEPVNPFRLDVPPALLSRPQVFYPDLLIGEPREEVLVSLTFVVGTDSLAEPGSITLTRPVDTRFAKRAIRAIQEARFRPGMLNDKPVRTRVFQQVDFRFH